MKLYGDTMPSCWNDCITSKKGNTMPEGVPTYDDDDDETEPLGTEPEGGEGDGTYPNPPAPSK